MSKRTKMPITRMPGQRVRVQLGNIVGWVTVVRGGRKPVIEFSFPPFVRIDREEVHLSKVRTGNRPADAIESDSDYANELDPDAIIGRHGE